MHLPEVPKAAKIPVTLSLHDDLRIDPYYWMQERENPEVRKYLNAENKYTEQVMAPVKNLRQTLYTEMRSRIKETDMSVPYFDRGYFYYVRYEEGMEHPVYCRKKENLEAPEEIILDANDRAKGHDFYKVSGLCVSPDNRMLAFGEDIMGRWIFTLRIKNLETGEILSDTIENTDADYAWAADSLTLLYTTKDETLRAYRVWMHICRLDPTKDVLVYEEKDEAFSVAVMSSKSEEYLFIESSSHTATEWQFAPSHLLQPFKIFCARSEMHEYGVEHASDVFYILTNSQAENFRLMTCHTTDTRQESWQERIPHRTDTLLEDMEIFKDFLVLEERHLGQSRIRIIQLADNEEHFISFDEPAHVVYCQVNPTFETPLLRIGYTSLTRPNTVYDYQMQTRQFTLLKELEVVGGHNSAEYVAERILVPSRDGKQIPASLVRHKDTATDGTAPMLLYGYGSYGHTVDPAFSTTRLSLLNRGFVFAIAHIRGSEMLGRSWYEDGKWLRKMNTFYDFIDVAQWLTGQRYTSSDRLFCMGGSAGGLLVGAVINMRPDLFCGAVAQVPFVDVITTMLDESIPLTTAEYDEWGNPNDPEYYFYMKKYSPYDNVKAQDYPHLLVTAGFHDSQVQYWEPAKWVAKLRDTKTDQNMLLLHTQMDAGHHGASGRFEGLKEIALEFSFLLHLVDKLKR